MNFLEDLLLTLGLSWRLSAILPIFIVLLFGLILGRFLFKKLKSSILKFTLIFLSGVLPALIYFSLFPIYQSDISNDFRVKQSAGNIRQEAYLEVLVLPDCPHCLLSTDMIAKLHQRQLNFKIHYTIVSSDSYGGRIEGKLKTESLEYDFRKHDSSLRSLSSGSYPSFVFHQKAAETLQIWNNNTFGTMSLDYIEDRIQD